MGRCMEMNAQTTNARSGKRMEEIAQRIVKCCGQECNMRDLQRVYWKGMPNASKAGSDFAKPTNAEFMTGMNELCLVGA